MCHTGQLIYLNFHPLFSSIKEKKQKQKQSHFNFHLWEIWLDLLPLPTIPAKCNEKPKTNKRRLWRWRAEGKPAGDLGPTRQHSAESPGFSFCLTYHMDMEVKKPVIQKHQTRLDKKSLSLSKDQERDAQQNGKLLDNKHYAPAKTHRHNRGPSPTLPA